LGDSQTQREILGDPQIK